MKTKDALRVYGTYAEIARVLGLTRQAPAAWGDTVPEGKAARLAELSGGRLRYRAAVYLKKPAKSESL